MSNDPEQQSPAYWITKEQVQTLLDYAHRYDALGLMVVANDVLAAPMQAIHAAEAEQTPKPKATSGDAGKLRDVNHG